MRVLKKEELAMLLHRKRLIVLALTIALVLVALAGGASHPAPALSDVRPQTYCWCYWNPTLAAWCYKCCSAMGCGDLYCTGAPNCGL
jgi:hypothetical protein